MLLQSENEHSRNLGECGEDTAASQNELRKQLLHNNDSGDETQQILQPKLKETLEGNSTARRLHGGSRNSPSGLNLHHNAPEFSEEKSADILEQLKDTGFRRNPGGSLMLLQNNNQLSPKVKEIRF